MDQYMGFYPPGDFWVGSAIDIWGYSEKLSEMLELGNFGFRSSSLGKQFEKEMSEEVFDYQEDHYRLKVCRDGLILFQHDKLDWQTALNGDPRTFESNWALCYDICNCINLIFHSNLCKQQFPVPGPDYSAYDFREISNRDLTLFSWKDGRSLTGFSLTKAIIPRLKKREVVSREETLSLIEMHHLVGPTLSRDFFDSMNDDLRKIMEDDSAISVASSLAKSLGQLKIGNFSISVVLSWFIIESQLNMRWEKLIEDKNETYESGRKRINKDRRDDLIEGRDFTMMVKSNFLELSGLISLERLDQVSEVRKVRNRIAHSGYNATHEEAGKAMVIVMEMIKEERQVELTLDRGISYST